MKDLREQRKENFLIYKKGAVNLMFIWLVGLIVFIVIFVSFLRIEGWSVETFFFPILIGVVSMLLAFLVSIIVSACVPQSVVGEVERTETQLIALKDNMAANGYCGGRYAYRGYIDEELQYTYLYEAKGKGITSGRCDADRTYINYIKGNESPKLITIKYDITNPIWNFFTCNDIVGASRKYEYYLYVPEGSIVAEGQYEVDLE